MSGNTIKLTKGVGEEQAALEGDTLYIPRKVVEENKAESANWRDDVEETAEEIDEKTGLSALETYDNEENYQSQQEVSRDALNRIEVFMKRSEFQATGRKVLAVFKKEVQPM